jgi:hypothetical protein
VTIKRLGRPQELAGNRLPADWVFPEVAWGLLGDPLEDDGHPFRIIEAAKLGDSGNWMARLNEEVAGVTDAHPAKHFPRGAPVKLAEFALEGAACHP